MWFHADVILPETSGKTPRGESRTSPASSGKLEEIFLLRTTFSAAVLLAKRTGMLSRIAPGRADVDVYEESDAEL